MTSRDKVLAFATAELGTAEIPGSNHNNDIVKYAQDIGLTWVNDDETPWCAIFMNWVLWKAGLSHTGSPAARSFENYSSSTPNPEPGDIVVFWRGKRSGWKGHVGVFIGFASDGGVFCLGGNQGNKVSIVKYKTEKILSFRSVDHSSANHIPDPTIRRGDDSFSVGILQKILKQLGYYVLKVDNDFGPGTERAVRLLQRSAKLPVTGVYSSAEKDYLFEILNQ
jgi:uncharacterized protein (TIGR02594 family)